MMRQLPAFELRKSRAWSSRGPALYKAISKSTMGFGHCLKSPPSLRKPHPARIALLIAVVAVWIILVFLRLGQLQILQHERFLKLARDSQEVTQPLLAPRGVIY